VVTLVFYGYADKTFKPEALAMRAEAAKIIAFITLEHTSIV
jgi:hypothetical protein